MRLLPLSMCSSPIYGAAAKALGSVFAFDSDVTSESVVLIQPDGRPLFTLLIPQPPHLRARQSAPPSPLSPSAAARGSVRQSPQVPASRQPNACRRP